MRRHVALLLVLASTALGKEPPEKEPGPKSAGKVCKWRTADGLEYLYRVPKDYDPEKGANVVFFIHGTNMDRYWGMFSHDEKTFRPDDILISPDGTTKTSDKGTFTFFGESADLQRMRTLHEEVKKAFKVRSTFLYGHSNGGFFSCAYASLHPEEIQGVFSHAGGVWAGTEPKPEQHGCAFAFMNGTDDPLMPVGNAVGGAEWYRKEGYPLTHWRVLEGHEHKPSHFHAVQQLAWCEGMTSGDPARVEASYDEIAGCKDRQWIDFSALYGVASRLAAMEGASEGAKKRAARTKEALEKLAEEHVSAIRKELGKRDGTALDGGAWIGHLPRFLLDFDGVPAREDLATEWAAKLETHREAANAHLRSYYDQAKRDPAAAFAAAAAAIREGFLFYGCYECTLPGDLDRWSKDAKKLKLDKADLDAYEAAMEARRDGLKAYVELNRKFKP